MFNVESMFFFSSFSRITTHLKTNSDVNSKLMEKSNRSVEVFSSFFRTFFLLVCFQIHMVQDTQTGKPRGYAFIEYEKESDFESEFSLKFSLVRFFSERFFFSSCKMSRNRTECRKSSFRFVEF